MTIKDNNFENNENTDEQIVKTPLELGQTSWKDVVKKHKDELQKLNFMANKLIYLPKDSLAPKQNMLLLPFFGRFFTITYKENKDEKSTNLGVMTFKMVANFKIIGARKIRKIFNNKSGENDLIYYQLDLESDTGCIAKDIEIQGNAKTDYKKFQELLSNQGNNFIVNFSESEFKTFVNENILPLLRETICIYSNCGIIKQNMFLYKNALVDHGKIYWADDKGLIRTLDPNLSFKANDCVGFPLPVLHKSERTSQMVAQDFIQNIIESWGANASFALLATGHMLMSVHYERFSKAIGSPMLVLAGASGSGKSTIVKNGAAIQGSSEDFLNAGDSTPLSHQYLAGSINGMNVCIDDINDKMLNSSNFNSTIKSAFKGNPRTKMKNYGQDIDFKQICSQIVYSTNDALPSLPELENRVNVFNITKTSLDTNKFRYLDKDIDNRKDLSVILPAFLEYDEKEVLDTYNSLYKYIDEQVKNVIPRIINNVAYAYTGVLYLLKIANLDIGNLHLDILDYAKTTNEHYNAIETPVDMLINSLLTLQNHQAITEETHYRIFGPNKTDSGQIHISFHKDTILSAYNKFFGSEPERKIRRNVFNNYLKTDPRVVRTDKTVRYNGKEHSSVVLDISAMEGVEDFSGVNDFQPMSADDLRASNNSNNM